MRELCWTVLPEEQGRTVRSLVPRRFCLGTHAFRRLKVREAILRNGVPVRADERLFAGDRLTVHLENEEGACPGKDSALCTLVYADKDLLVVSKGAPLPTLPSAHQPDDTLRELLARRLGLLPDRFHYHPVNRLDKGTSGLLVVARHAHAQRLLSGALHTDRFRREYLALTQGVPPADEGTIDAPIARLGSGARRGIVAEGKPAQTHYRVLSTDGERALLRLRLFTGRTHQIRVHLQSLGCPILGDYLYGAPDPRLPGRFALHAASLVLRHPLRDEELRFESPLPPELQRLSPPL